VVFSVDGLGIDRIGNTEEGDNKKLPLEQFVAQYQKV
jgi:hypothetical protein